MDRYRIETSSTAGIEANRPCYARKVEVILAASYPSENYKSPWTQVPATKYPKLPEQTRREFFVVAKRAKIDDGRTRHGGSLI